MSDQNFNPQQPQYVDPQQAYAQPQYAMPPQYAQPGYAMPPQYAQPGYAAPAQYAQPGYAMPPQYAQPGYAMPPQYAQPQVPYGQPQYYAAPQPTYEAPAPAEPEVILQETPFADFGFGEEDSVGSSHNFGGFMEDDNQVQDEPDDFNAFNAQTPNFDPAAVEAASKITEEDKAMFTSTTPNLDISAVEAASKQASAEDIDIFSNSMAVGEREQTMSETPSFDAATASLAKNEEPLQTPTFTISIEENPAPVVAEPIPEPAPAAPAAPSAFMASMASMMSSLNGASAAPVVAEPAPAVPVAPVVPAAPAPQEVPAEPESPVFSQPDVVVSAAPSQTIQDISSSSASDDKSDDYWKNIDKMLNNFDDGQYHQDISNPIHIEEEKQEETDTEEAESRFPFSESAQAANAAPVAPTHIPNQFATTTQQVVTPAPEVAPVQPTPASVQAPTPVQAPAPTITPVPVPNFVDAPAYAMPSTEAVPIEEEPGEVLDKKAAREAARAERDAKRAEQRAQRDAEKAAKAEAKAQAKAEKLEAKASKKNEAVVDEPEKEEELIDKPTGFKGFIYSIFPNKNDKIPEIIRKVIALVAVVALIVCGIYFLVTFIGSKAQEKSAEELSSMMDAAEGSAQDWADIYTRYPEIQFPTGMQIKFADLYALNQDLAGWITIEGLGIDYPVVQTTDDSFYLKHDFYKESSAYGTIFMSANNSLASELDLNTVVYGHAMRRDKQMFARLHDYKDKQTFIDNPIIEFNTLYGNYKFKVYCVFITNGSAADDNGYLLDYTFTNLASQDSFAGFIGELSLRELYHTGVDIAPTDKIICLSTCSYEFDNARFVVVGRLLRDGESEEIDTSKVTENQSENGIRYPQAWYDANGKTNPYASYTHWQPTT